MIGHPDERDLERWASADLAALRDDLDHVLNADAASSDASGVPTSSRPPSDAELLDAVRGGEIQAYGQLFERHVRAARSLARHLARSGAEADDLVSDAFAKVLDAVRAGGGPESAFRAYLLTALRHTAYDKTRRDKKLKLADDLEAVSGVERVTTVPFHDPALATLERSLATRAFASLPERWQTVLWQTEIEGQSASELAKLLGLTANGASALAYRAREGLKTAYLQAHLADNPTTRCRATVAKLAAWTRGGLTKRETAQVEAHLDECGTCRAMAAELADVNGTLRAVVAPLVLGAGVSGYLAATAGTAEAGAVAVGAGAAAHSVTTTAQWLGVAASATAVVAAVVLGVNTGQQPVVPTVDAQAPATTVDLGTSVAVSGTSSVPSSGVDLPSATTTATEPGGRPSPPPGSDVPTTTTTAPAGQPLTPDVPAEFSVSSGGPPVNLPVIVRNTGSSPLESPTVVLSLPEGVQVVGKGNNLRGGDLVRFDGAAAQTVGCPAGKGTVTCAAEGDIPVGGQATFLFRLLAGPKAVGGTIQGTVGSGSTPPVPVQVPLAVTPR
ncbi:RNA polymerase sigma factor (sigma-70 family) [Saccharothrix saharensis]|uniref:RNA polymerase sigma factor (Sigma-70 family) n=1 Tax=Saccharothrix saharensis TaxID=571190 RepID=A0A543JQP3_9PSEU|nr:sigma-70 family RNA polymerase sigma factor [Saccharothrix saharensis]TQM85172.1 RNA polymerase sigma factor (sigma-70 family) [Saccharothrix saharensis]